MATYAITFSDDDHYGEKPAQRYKTRAEANERFAEENAKGKFVRMVKWENNDWKEMDRANG